MKRLSWKRLGAILAFGAAAYSVGSLFQPTVVVGESMAPTLDDGKVIYVDRLHYRSHVPRRGEVVVFHHDEDTYVKRVYRGPGETVHYLGDGYGLVHLVAEKNLDLIRERYAHPRGSIQLKSLVVPPGHVYVLGDNYSRSEDSRQLGPIPIGELMGRARVDVDPNVASHFEYRLRRRPVQAAVHVAPAAQRPTLQHAAISRG